MNFSPYFNDHWLRTDRKSHPYSYKHNMEYIVSHVWKRCFCLGECYCYYTLTFQDKKGVYRESSQWYIIYVVQKVIDLENSEVSYTSECSTLWRWVLARLARSNVASFTAWVASPRRKSSWDAPCCGTWVTRSKRRVFQQLVNSKLDCWITSDAST